MSFLFRSLCESKWGWQRSFRSALDCYSYTGRQVFGAQYLVKEEGNHFSQGRTIKWKIMWYHSPTQLYHVIQLYRGICAWKVEQHIANNQLPTTQQWNLLKILRLSILIWQCLWHTLSTNSSGISCLINGLKINVQEKNWGNPILPSLSVQSMDILCIAISSWLLCSISEIYAKLALGF